MDGVSNSGDAELDQMEGMEDINLSQAQTAS